MDKLCKRCGETKPLEGFHVRRRSPDGHQTYCKRCMITMVRSHYENRHDHVLALRRARQQDQRDEQKPYVPPSIYDVVKVPGLATLFAYLDMPTATDYARAA